MSWNLFTSTTMNLFTLSQVALQALLVSSTVMMQARCGMMVIMILWTSVVPTKSDGEVFVYNW